MKKIFYTIVFGFVLLGLSGCGGTDGSCCESAIVLEKNIIHKSPNPMGDPSTKGDEDNQTDDATLLPPVAIISPDVQSIKAKLPTTFNCAKSYDKDEQGEKIVECIWKFKCFKNSKFACDCPEKRGTITDGVVITPPNAQWVDYLEVTLTVVDDENQTNTVVRKFDIVE